MVCGRGRDRGRGVWQGEGQGARESFDSKYQLYVSIYRPHMTSHDIT